MTRRPRFSTFISYEDFQEEVFSYLAFNSWSNSFRNRIGAYTEDFGRSWIDSNKAFRWTHPFHDGQANANQVKRWLDKMAEDGLLERRRWGRPTPYRVTLVGWDSPACRRAVENANQRIDFLTRNPSLYPEIVRNITRPRKTQLSYAATRHIQSVQPREERARSGRREPSEVVYRVR